MGQFAIPFDDRFPALAAEPGKRNAHDAAYTRVRTYPAIYQKPRTTRPHPEYQVYLYLFKGVAIERLNHVWTADIAYIPVQFGFLYLVAVMDWAARRAFSWRFFNTLDARFCKEALTEAL